MKWGKLGNENGLIFSPKEYGLEYAKSPQAIVFEKFVRIYFSTCETDQMGKYISKVAYVDMDKKFSKVLNISTDVLKRGEIGCYDEHGVFPFSPMKYGDKIYGYISGWSRRVSVSTDTGIGLAISEDQGETFERIGPGPILSSSLNEPFLVIDGFVRLFEDKFHMWYIYGTEWRKFPDNTEPDRVYKITHATSDDGIMWKREGRQIIDDKVEFESQALPTVAKYNGIYHMFFCYRYSNDFRKNPERSYRIGYAYSHNLKDWMRDDSKIGIDVVEDSWASNMLCYPNVFIMNDEMYLLYNGNDFGKSGFGIVKLEGF